MSTEYPSFCSHQYEESEETTQFAEDSTVFEAENVASNKSTEQSEHSEPLV